MLQCANAHVIPLPEKEKAEGQNKLAKLKNCHILADMEYNLLADF